MNFDLVVVGSGPAGAAAAIAAARAGLRVCMITGAPRERTRAGETLPAAAARLLDDLGVMHVFERMPRVRCAGSVSVWGSEFAHANDAIADPLGHGWQIERATFDAMLIDAALQNGVESVRADARDVSRKDGVWTIVAGALEARAAWVIDASGRRRTVVRQCNSIVERLDRLVAFGLHVEDDQTDTDSRTLVEAGENGWWYSSRIPARGRIVAFLSDADLAPRDLLHAHGWHRRASETRHIRAMLSNRDLEQGRTFTADASSTRLSHVSGDGWLAVGDAAISFDPLSSQGVFNALCTGVEGSAAVSACLAGDDQGIARYEQMVDTVWSIYAERRALYYQAERRWPRSAFWLRRQMERPASLSA